MLCLELLASYANHRIYLLRPSFGNQPNVSDFDMKSSASIESVHTALEAQGSAEGECTGAPIGTENRETKERDFDRDVLQTFKGHLNRRTVIKEATFYGDSEYIVSGSDDGRVFIWDRSGKLKCLLKADKVIVMITRTNFLLILY